MNDAFRELPRILKEIEHFNMVHFSWRENCGTAYCLAGACAVDPWMIQHTNIDKLFIIRADGTFRQTANRNQLAELFDISVDDAYGLFIADVSQSVTKEMVQTNIDLIASGKPPVSYTEMLQPLGVV